MAYSGRVDPGRAGRVKAVLGPTNTGKTHVALQRMLGHRTGIIGLPLRLLAREIYDRLVRERGRDQVALITGEEKIVPAETRYWVCTVESMPLDRPVAFVAVDEVQLAADRQRGHVFTDRILHARGVAETWFLGADTMAGLLQTLVPGIEIVRQPRLSKLSYVGPRRLTALPPRTAVVAFSMREVYALAERLRHKHGGTAVVLGALSPRTRNAQVELYQSGEVQHMVATDAIGMGLNMDIHHVALAGAHKYDGRSYRPLRADELAQIAGRAGRFKRDGTFGTTGGLEPLEPDVVHAIEHHLFEPVRRVFWRNNQLDFSAPDALVASLLDVPTHRVLRSAERGDDLRALIKLLEDEELLSLARDESRLRLLWDVCGVPDFGNLIPEHHALLLGQIFRVLLRHAGALPDDWMADQLQRIDRVDGDLETIMGRVAAIRVWTYVANRGDWLTDASAWQERTRQVEDRLSDTLHRRLLERFVDHRATAIRRGAVGGLDDRLTPELAPGGHVLLAGQSVARMRGVTLEIDPEVSRSPVVAKAVRKAVRDLMQQRLDELLDADDSSFYVRETGAVWWRGGEVARLVRAEDWRRPGLVIVRHASLDGSARGALDRRLRRWHQSWLANDDLLSHVDRGVEPSVRALAHALSERGGAVLRGEVSSWLSSLTASSERALARLGVRVGQKWVYRVRTLERARARWIRWRLVMGEGTPDLPDDGGFEPFEAAWPPHMCAALGFHRVGTWLLRVDVYEAILDRGQDEACARGLPVETARQMLAPRSRS